MSLKKVHFLIYNEVIWNKGLVYSQNLLPLIYLKKDNPEIEVNVHYMLPILKLVTKWKSIKKFIGEVEAERLKFHLFPSIMPMARISLRWFFIPFHLVVLLPYLLLVKQNEEQSIWHARSYFPALALSLLSWHRNKFVFDPRSDFINENEGFSWSKYSFTHRQWKNIEHKILLKADISIFISKAMKVEICERHGLDHSEHKYTVLYNPIDFDFFKSCFNTARKEVKFIYTGSLNNWNNLDSYLSFFKQISPYFPQATLQIFTKTPRSKLKNLHLLENDDIFKNRVSMDRVAPHELAEKYKDFSFGLQLMSTPDSRVGVKFVEYLAAGIIPITNTNVKGAVEIVKQFGYGLVLQEDFNRDKSKIKLLAEQIKDSIKQNEKQKNSKFYNKLYNTFDVKMNAKKLLKIYLNE